MIFEVPAAERLSFVLHLSYTIWCEMNNNSVHKYDKSLLNSHGFSAQHFYIGKGALDKSSIYSHMYNNYEEMSGSFWILFKS